MCSEPVFLPNFFENDQIQEQFPKQSNFTYAFKHKMDLPFHNQLSTLGFQSSNLDLVISENEYGGLNLVLGDFLSAVQKRPRTGIVRLL